jgi:hypothetical protein
MKLNIKIFNNNIIIYNYLIIKINKLFIKKILKIIKNNNLKKNK